MDTVVQAMTVLAAFAAVHERVIELIRNFNQRFLASRIALVRNIAHWIDVATTDYRNIVFALVLAVATRADLLALFQYNNSNHSRFFDEYLHGWPYELYKLDRSEFVRQIMGCVLMGMSTALGSQFWHDFSKGLIDLRDRSKAVANLASAEAASRTSVPKLPPSEIPPAGFLTALSGIAGTATRRVPPPTQPPA